MSDENVETVRKAIEAFNESGIDGLVAYSRDDLVTYAIPEWLEEDVYHGPEGLRRVLSWQETFERLEWEPLEIRAVGERVLVHARLSAEMKTGGAIHEEFGAVLSRVGEGKVGELRFFRTWREALEAGGARD
jgi:hypothetical protein